jgi:Rab GDP dissociation inhibitor
MVLIVVVVLVRSADPSPGWFSTAHPMDLQTMTMRQLYAKFGVSDYTMDLTGHAIALHLDDKYLDEPAHPTLLKVQLYYHSLAKFGQSPYIYPLYGLGELPQAFAR